MRHSVGIGPRRHWNFTAFTPAWARGGGYDAPMLPNQGPPDLDTPCTACRHFGGLVARGYSAICLRDPGGHLRCGQALGCCHWEREPGSDDEVLPEVRARVERGWPVY